MKIQRLSMAAIFSAAIGIAGFAHETGVPNNPLTGQPFPLGELSPEHQQELTEECIVEGCTPGEVFEQFEEDGAEEKESRLELAEHGGGPSGYGPAIVGGLVGAAGALIPGVPPPP